MCKSKILFVIICDGFDFIDLKIRLRIMAPPNIEAHYKELLNPVKDPEKSFSVNIAELLQDYLTNLVRGRVPPNFNSAALLLQGSSSIYGKKVEYIYNLANQLHQKLAKQQKAEQQNRKETAKEKEKQKEEKLSDPFLCTEIKLGKNLSCLKRKNSPKNIVNKRPCKKTQLMKSVFVPVLLLALEDDEKGDVIFDTRGEIVGHKGDFVLNKCTLTSSGWLLLPTMNRDLVPSDPAAADYIEEESEKEDCDTDDVMPADSGDPSSSPDEGLGTDPHSVSSNSQNLSPDGCSVSASNDDGIGTVDSPQSSTVTNSQDRGSDLTPSDQLLALSEGQNDANPGLTPSDQPQETEEQEANANSPAKPASEGIENVPVLDNSINDDDDALHPIRRSIRQALKVCQLEQQINIRNSTESVVVQKAIQKRNTRYLPAKLRMSKTEFTLNSTPEFCARTFFSMDSKLSKNGYCNFEMPAFSKNCNFFQRLTEKLEFLKSANRKNKKSDEAVDNENIEVDVMRDDDLPDSPPDTDFLPCHIDDDDIRIENCPENNLSEAPEVALDPEFPTEENPLAEDPPQKSLRELAQEQFDLCSKELQKFSVTTELSEAAREWEESIIPFLEEQEKRENFDIDVYGSRILNAFEDNNRKQSMYFRHFCKNMQKWEIHRYFMALLPLANIGNVAIDKERREDGSDDIIVTLLSRKMHHKELEEFGHSEGSHP